MKYYSISILFILLISCYRPVNEENADDYSDSDDFVERGICKLHLLPDSNITDFQRCDIIVKPNLNWLPGTSCVPGGFGFGHAAIVIEETKDTSETQLLMKVLIMEAQARDVDPKSQVRKVQAYVPGNDFNYANYNFSPDFLGRFYRLRMPLNDEQKREIIAYLLEHDSDMFSTRAAKDYDKAISANENHTGEKEIEYWYCSLLIWQAFYDVMGIDLDANQGLYVYPNDLINSPYFDNHSGSMSSKVRF